MGPTDEITLHVIARIYNDFPTKFALPRQSGLIKKLSSRVIFEPEFRQQEAIRGLEQFSHIWLFAVRRQYTHGRFRHTITLSPESNRAIMRAVRGFRTDRGKWNRAPRFRSRFDERHTYL